MNVLAIGNSFSQDATRYLHDIARKRGEDIQVVNLYIGGCPLERHFRNMLSGERVYGLECNGQLTGFQVSLREALLNRNWDVITIQQASMFSFRRESYEPYAETLVEYIRSCAPRARIIMHETWAYEDGSDMLKNRAGFDSAMEMLTNIVECYRGIHDDLEMDGLIPSGEMLYRLIENGMPVVHRDTFHASLGAGRYAIGLLWYQCLTGNSAAEDNFDDLDVPATAEELAIVRRTVEEFR